MRKDMFKVIVERPRRGVHRAPRVKLRHDRVPDRSKVGMKRGAYEQRGWTKGLSENLAPLQRYLRKQRGRPWDKVYGEICARLDIRSAVKQHVRDHLEDLIAYRVIVEEDGTLWEARTRGWPKQQPLHESYCELYVDPKDGIIKEMAKFRRKLGLPVSLRTRLRKLELNNEDVIALDDLEDLWRIDGIWYYLRYLPLADAPQTVCGCRHCCSRRPPTHNSRPLADKRQLSKAELKERGLSNEVTL